MKSFDPIETIVLSAERLRGLAFDQELIRALLDRAGLILLRRKLGKHRPLLVGLIGCTGTGKSTLFNSLAAKDISRTGWAAHNTQGPVLLAANDFFMQLREIENRYGSLLFPALQREVYYDSPGSESPSKSNGIPASLPKSISDLTGAPDGVFCIASNSQVLTRYGNPSASLALIDLPDINTTLARDERLVTLDLQLWLDAVIFVMDDETVYHRDYEPPARRADELEQSRFCVLNHRGKDRVVLDHPDMEKVRELFGVKEIHLLTEFKTGTRFFAEAAFLQLQESLYRTIQPAPETPLLRELSHTVEAVLEENRKKRNHLDTLTESIEQILHDLPTHESPIPLECLLSPEVLQILHHLGLRRFSLSNVGHFLKRVVTTGAVKRSFYNAFGDRRDFGIEQIFHFDPSKLREEVHKRIFRYRETITETIFQQPNIDAVLAVAPELKNQLLGTQENSASPQDSSQKAELDRSLNLLVADFEKQCRDLAMADTLENSIKNDPLIAFSMVLALMTDIFIIPGFGSWLLTPTIFHYLPIGKFEQLKWKFQRSLLDVIQRNLLWIPRYIQEVKLHAVLEETDALNAALQVCADYHDTSH